MHALEAYGDRSEPLGLSPCVSTFAAPDILLRSLPQPFSPQIWWNYKLDLDVQTPGWSYLRLHSTPSQPPLTRLWPISAPYRRAVSSADTILHSRCLSLPKQISLT